MPLEIVLKAVSLLLREDTEFGALRRCPDPGVPSRSRAYGRSAVPVDLFHSELLTLTGNIRPQHNAPTLKGKTRTKVDRWTRELLANNAVIGNISIRLNRRSR